MLDKQFEGEALCLYAEEVAVGRADKGVELSPVGAFGFESLEFGFELCYLGLAFLVCPETRGGFGEQPCLLYTSPSPRDS